jgi:hypothetical protein
VTVEVPRLVKLEDQDRKVGLRLLRLSATQS